MKGPLTVYIGFDEREAEAFDVCKFSLERHASVPVLVKKLDVETLRNIGVYSREYRSIGLQKIDRIDGKPFSTDFSFSRFLVPALSLYQGWSLFCDGDFLFRDDVAKLFAHADPQYAAQVVKREYQPTEAMKMDGIAQQMYRRKMWSSLILFNNEHLANRVVNPSVVNSWSGADLHAFSWLRDDQIGELPPTWNWLSRIDNGAAEPQAVHFTLGIPSMDGYGNSPYADEWFQSRISAR